MKPKPGAPFKGGRSATLLRWADTVEAALQPHASGLTADQVVAVTGLSLHTVKKALQASSARSGCAYQRQITGKCVWWHWTQFAAMADQRERMRAEHTARAAAKRRQVAAQDEALTAVERPPVQLWVSAAEAPPLRPRGPASVWGLAA